MHDTHALGHAHVKCSCSCFCAVLTQGLTVCILATAHAAAAVHYGLLLAYALWAMTPNMSTLPADLYMQKGTLLSLCHNALDYPPCVIVSCVHASLCIIVVPLYGQHLRMTLPPHIRASHLGQLLHAAMHADIYAHALRHCATDIEKSHQAAGQRGAYVYH